VNILQNLPCIMYKWGHFCCDYCFVVYLTTLLAY
jgi:hypothetical protein